MLRLRAARSVLAGASRRHYRNSLEWVKAGSPASAAPEAVIEASAASKSAAAAAAAAEDAGAALFHFLNKGGAQELTTAPGIFLSLAACAACFELVYFDNPYEKAHLKVAVAEAPTEEDGEEPLVFEGTKYEGAFEMKPKA